jgi:hypothetical protein
MAGMCGKHFHDRIISLMVYFNVFFLKIDYYKMVHSNSENNNISLAAYYNTSTIYRYEAFIQV